MISATKGASTALSFRVSYLNPGFENEGSDIRIVENGTFIDGDYLPGLGYFAQKELLDDETRRKYDQFGEEGLKQGGQAGGQGFRYV